jgi:hypothetical protein
VLFQILGVLIHFLFGRLEFAQTLCLSEWICE